MKETDDISPEHFVATWQMSESMEECLRVLGEFAGRVISEEEVRARAESYRDAGVKLKLITAENQKPVAHSA